MIQFFPPDEVQRHDKMLTWVKETLEGEYGTYLYNFLNGIQQLILHMERKKVEEWKHGFETGVKEKQRDTQ